MILHWFLVLPGAFHLDLVFHGSDNFVFALVVAVLDCFVLVEVEGAVPPEILVPTIVSLPSLKSRYLQ